MSQSQIQVETPGHLRAARVVRIKSPHGALIQVDCVGGLGIVRRRSWKSVSERKPADPLVEDEIVLEGETQGAVQVMINDWAYRICHLVMFGQVDEIVLGHGLTIPSEIPQERQGITSGGVEFYVVADASCIVEPAPIMTQSYPEIRRRLG